MALAKKEVWAWVLLAAAVVTLNCVRYQGPLVFDDSYQYISIAENIAGGNGIRTSIVHFDEERRHGELPAPVTWFPAGYPIAISLLALIGFSPMWAGFVLSGASLCTVVWVTAWLCGWYQLTAVATRLVLFCMILNTATLQYSSAVLSEALYTALSVGAIALLAFVSERTGKAGQAHRVGLWALCGLLIGVSCWVRYAGYFLYASLGVYLAIEVVFRRRRDLRGPIAAVVAATIPLAALLLRNVALAGNWRGGNTKAVFMSAAVVARKVVGAVYQLFFGTLRLQELGIPEALVVLALGVTGVLAIWIALKNRKAIVSGLKERPSLLPVVVYLSVYFGALLYLSFFSVAGISDRYCYPMLALLFLLIGMGITLVAPHMGRSGMGRATVASAALLLGCYLFLNVRDILRPLRSGSAFLNRQIAEYLEAPMASGESLRSWIDANMPAEAHIIAADGQATAHVLHRKAVSLVSHEYSPQNWEGPQMLELMTGFQADFLILYRGTPSRAAPEVQAESEFLTALAEGRQAPDWLHLAAENPHVKIFRRSGLGVPQANIGEVR
jgi:hypothetical protein